MRTFITFLPGIAFAIFSVGLDVSGYQNPTLGFVLWGVSVFLILAAAVYWLISVVRRRDLLQTENERLGDKLRKVEQEREGFRQESEELRKENTELIAEAESGGQPVYLPDTLEEWLKTTPLTTVPNQTYRNDRIELDGYFYEHCTFEDCTFSFRGQKSFRISADSNVKGMVNIDARGPQLQALLVFMKQLGALHPNSQWYDFYDGRLID